MRGVLLFVVALITVCNVATAQFVPERIFVGPTVGLGAFGGGLAYGGILEYAMNENFGLTLNVGYTSFTEDFAGFGFPSGSFPVIDYSLFAALVGGTYHFMPAKKFDPYIALGVGYFSWDVKYTQDGEETDPFAGYLAAYTSGVGFTGSIGARYHFSDLISARLSLGYPVLAGVGVDFAFGGVTPAPKATDSTGATQTTTTAAVADTATGPAYALFLGAYVSGKGSIKTEVGNGFKTGPVFNVPPDFGISIMAPFGAGTNIGFALDLGMATYGYLQKPESNANDSNTIKEQYTYFNVFPHFNISGFIVGVNWGSPISASTLFLNGDSASVVGKYQVDTVGQDTVTYTPDNIYTGYDPTQYLAGMIELRIGGSIPVVDSKVGRLCVNIMAGYTLSSLFEDFRNYQGAYPLIQDDNNVNAMKRGMPQESLNPVMPSLAIGIQWDFRLGL